MWSSTIASSTVGCSDTPRKMRSWSTWARGREIRETDSLISTRFSSNGRGVASGVVRLKGGDPFIFGRGGEEVAALAEANVPFEVVPGITSAIGAPTYAGIPLTHRGVASSLTIVTGSESPDKAGASVDWDGLAKSEGTLSLLMSWENLPAITQALIDGGRAANTPAAVVQWGTWPDQRTVVGPLHRYR